MSSYSDAMHRPIPGPGFEQDPDDGQLRAMVNIAPMGWHMSISHAKQTKVRDSSKVVPGRYPTWDEIADARDCLLPSDVDFVMHLPRTDGDEYVAVHATTFHLHEYPEREAGQS